MPYADIKVIRADRFDIEASVLFSVETERTPAGYRVEVPCVHSATLTRIGYGGHRTELGDAPQWMLELIESDFSHELMREYA